MLLAAATALTTLHAQAPRAADGKIPITTSSEDARRAYLQGRDLAEKLRATDARRLYTDAVARDPNFALAHLGLANTAGTNKEFVDAVTRAATLAAGASEGERLMIRAVEAGLKGDPAGTLTRYKELVKLFPNDERALTLLGNAHFGRQEYDNAIAQYTRATAINPSFSQPYNQLGYAYRFIEKFGDAETAFKKYIELIPGDPNPYDSYAELLMKMGRFDESIKMYEKALSIDPNFVASYVGIGNDHLAAGRTDQARAAFAKLASVARNTGERRQAHFWTAASYVHDAATDKAIAELKAGYALAEAERDAGSMSGDLTLMGDVLREAGRLDEALARYAEAVAVAEKSQLPPEVKDAARRNHLFEEARVAAVRKDVAAARAKTSAYEKAIAGKNRPFEALQHHELLGLIALAEQKYTAAAAELAKANQQDPRILYRTAVALRDGGDQSKAAAAASKAAKFNGLNFNYAFVKARAAKIGS
jgi:tetratricopeptide (TPR) repeat protein